MIIFKDQQCFRCQHLDHTPVDARCPAFKDGRIPEKIWNNDIEHKDILPEQVKPLTFTPKEEPQWQ